jgi:hypothetical protein
MLLRREDKASVLLALGSPAAMAIRTPHHALGNLQLDSSDRVRVDHLSYVAVLHPSDVVKVQYNRIWLFAVDAWMDKKIFEYEARVLVDERPVELGVLILVETVIPTPLLLVACLAKGLKAICPSTVFVEVSGFLAARAYLHAFSLSIMTSSKSTCFEG